MQCAFAVAEVRKVTANLLQTCGFAVAEHLLQFCGICGCGIEFQFAVPSSARKSMAEICGRAGRLRRTIKKKVSSYLQEKNFLRKNSLYILNGHRTLLAWPCCYVTTFVMRQLQIDFEIHIEGKKLTVKKG